MTPINLLCLVSEQTLANAVPARQLGVTNLLLVHTSDVQRSGRQARWLDTWWQASGGGATWQREVADAFDYPALHDALAQFIDQHAAATWVINITGGTKPMSLAALAVARERDYRAVYSDDRGQRLLTFHGPQGPEPLTAAFGVEELLGLYGITPRRLSTYAEPARRIAAALAQDRALVDRALQSKHGLPTTDAAVAALQAAGALAATTGDGHLPWTRDAAALLGKAGNWLEAVTTEAFVRAGATDVVSGVEVAGGESDVVATFGTRLVLAECKAGPDLCDHHFAQLDGRTRAFGGLMASGVMVWSPPSDLDPQRRHDKRRDYRRMAKERKLRLVENHDPAALATELRQWLGLS